MTIGRLARLQLRIRMVYGCRVAAPLAVVVRRIISPAVKTRRSTLLETSQFKTWYQGDKSNIERSLLPGHYTERIQRDLILDCNLKIIYCGENLLNNNASE